MLNHYFYLLYSSARLPGSMAEQGKKKNSPKKMSPKKKESKNRKEGQGHSNPGSPSKLGFRDAKKGKIESAGARIPCTISIDDSDDEKVGVKVEHVEESVDGKMKDKVVEVLKEQLIEQKRRVRRSSKNWTECLNVLELVVVCWT